MKQTILIVNYDLGTTNGVGGRRWALLGGALLESGEEVHFLTTRQDIPEELHTWKDRIHSFQTAYPKIINNASEKIVDKIIYRFNLLRLKIFNKGTIFDLGKRDKNRFLDSCKNLIKKHDIRICIVTGAPFSYLYYGTLLKREFPGLILVSDFRDKWTEGYNYGMRQLNKRRMAFERACELAVIQQSDLVTVASEDVGDYLKQRYNRDYMVLYNAVSPLLQNAVKETEEPSRRPYFHLVHVGNISEGCEEQTEHLIQSLSLLESTQPGRFRFSLVGCSNRNIVRQFTEAGLDSLALVDRLPQKALGELMNTADAFVIFNRAALSKSIPTKFFDYIIFRKPLIAYKINGKLAEMIERRQIGILLDSGETPEMAAAELLELASGNRVFDLSHTNAEFTAAHQATQLMKAISQRNS
jgi:hypothetical protein